MLTDDVMISVHLCVSWIPRWLPAPPWCLPAAAGVWGGGPGVGSDPRRRQLWAGRGWGTHVWSNQTAPSQHGPWLHDVQVSSTHWLLACLPFHLFTCLTFDLYIYRSYLDMMKVIIFSYMFWFVLTIIFITGTTRWVGMPTGTWISVSWIQRTKCLWDRNILRVRVRVSSCKTCKVVSTSIYDYFLF